MSVKNKLGLSVALLLLYFRPFDNFNSIVDLILLFIMAIALSLINAD